MVLGLKRGVVELVDHDPKWKNAATDTIKKLWQIFGTVAKDIQHIGSTAIDNIKAKPIIDIGVLIDDFSEAEALYSELENNGFSNRGLLLDKQSMVFSMGEDIPPDDRITTHYIHIVKSGDTDWRDYIAFRDYLNANTSIAKAYETIKIKLASEYPYDKGRLKYVDGKSNFISQTLHNALIWAQIKFNKISDFNERILFSDLLVDAYSFDKNLVDTEIERWRESDNFFYDYVGIETADTCCVITTLNNEVIGFICWDPRNLPKYAIIGDNCIITKHKGKGYGKLQLQEAINRITKNGGEKVFVTTNDSNGFIPAQRMYESVGMKKTENSTLELWKIYYSMDICPE